MPCDLCSGTGVMRYTEYQDPSVWAYWCPRFHPLTRLRAKPPKKHRLNWQAPPIKMLAANVRVAK